MITWSVARKCLTENSLKLVKDAAKDKKYKLGNKNIIRILNDLFVDNNDGYRIINTVLGEIREVKTKPVF